MCARLERATSAFGDKVRSYPWTRDFGVAARYLKSCHPHGRTALYKAVATSIDSLARRAGRRRIVVLSDGKDNVGGYTLNQLITRAKAAKVAIFAIGLAIDTRAAAPLIRPSGQR